jgi:hypothetical protein
MRRKGPLLKFCGQHVERQVLQELPLGEACMQPIADFLLIHRHVHAAQAAQSRVHAKRRHERTAGALPRFLALRRTIMNSRTVIGYAHGATGQHSRVGKGKSEHIIHAWSMSQPTARQCSGMFMLWMRPQELSAPTASWARPCGQYAGRGL